MNLELIKIFVKIVQCGSFSKAAEILELPKSTISKSLTKLESETGTKLLFRTTRNQTLTIAGQEFYGKCLGPIQILDEAQKSLYGKDKIISGNIKITMPEDFGVRLIAPAITELCKKYPLLTFELNETNQVVDLVKDGIDIAVRIGKLTESRLKQKKIGDMLLVLVAAPQYLESTEIITTAKQLEKHSCLAIHSHPFNKAWKIKNQKETISIFVQPKIQSNQMLSLLEMTIAGAGIAYVPLFLCKQYFSTGALVRVLPEWEGIALPVSLVSPLSFHSSVRIKFVSDHIANTLKQSLEVKL